MSVFLNEKNRNAIPQLISVDDVTVETGSDFNVHWRVSEWICVRDFFPPFLIRIVFSPFRITLLPARDMRLSKLRYCGDILFPSAANYKRFVTICRWPVERVQNNATYLGNLVCETSKKWDEH